MYTLVVYFSLAFGASISQPAILEAEFPNWTECMNKKHEMLSSINSRGSYSLIAFCIPSSKEKEKTHVLDRLIPRP